MHKLKSPDQFPGRRAQGYNGIGPLIVARTQSTVIIGAGAACGNKDEIRLRVCGHDRPGIRGSAAPLAWAGLAGWLAARDRIPTPAQRPTASIEPSNHTTRHIHTAVVVDSGTYHNYISDLGRGRRHVIPARLESGYIPQADLSILTKIRTGVSVSRINRDESRINGGFEDSPPARFGRGPLPIHPGNDSTIDESVSRLPVAVNLGIVGPQLSSCFGIERNYAVEGRGEIELAIHHDRRGFKSARFRTTCAVGDVARMESPGNS